MLKQTQEAKIFNSQKYQNTKFQLKIVLLRIIIIINLDLLIFLIIENRYNKQILIYNYFVIMGHGESKLGGAYEPKVKEMLANGQDPKDYLIEYCRPECKKWQDKLRRC